VLPVQGFDPLFAGIWVIGGPARVVGRVMRKFHRLAALMLIGGTGIVTAADFPVAVAPDLALPS